jgi:hypothetical protein
VKDTHKAIVRTIMGLVGAYFIYQAIKVKAPEPGIIGFIGLILLLGAVISKKIGIAFLVLGVIFCGIDYFKLSHPGFGPNFDPAAYVVGLFCFIIGGIFFMLDYK